MPLARKLGKRPPRFDHRTLRLASYLTPALPPPPPRVDWTRGFNINYGMMLNDSLGDCVEAAKGHAGQVWSLCNGRLVTVPDSIILSNYEANGGYVPGDASTDNGEVELDSLKAWRKNGFGGHSLSAFAAIDPSIMTHVLSGIYLFGLAYIGFSVPQSAMDQNDRGETWDVVQHDGGIVGGHAVIVPAYNTADDTLTCITWGMRQRMTFAFWNRYVDESYALLSVDWLIRGGMNPSGFDMTALAADLVAVTA